MAQLDIDFEDDAFDEDLEEELDALDHRLFGSESGEVRSGSCSDHFTSPCRLPSVFPKRGKCVSASGSGDRCEDGLWYMPKFGDTLYGVARRALRAAGVSTRTVSVRDYAKQISRHVSNHQYHSIRGTGLATRQFLRRWDVEVVKHRGRVVRRFIVEDPSGGGYGLMFLPPIFAGRIGTLCDFRKLKAKRPLC